MSNETSAKLVADLTFITNTILGGKVHADLRPFLFGANLFALSKPTPGTRPIAVGNTLRRLAAKCAGKDHDFLQSRKSSYGTLQLGFGTKNGCEAAVHATRKYLTSEKISDEHVLVKIDFENAFNTISRQHMLRTISEKYPRLKNFAFATYGEPSYLFFDSHIILSDEGAQQGDPEASPMFCDGINEMVQRLSSELNFWYLDDGNLADRYQVVLADLKLVITLARLMGLKVRPSKCELIFLGNPDENLRRAIHHEFNCPEIEITPTDDLSILGSGIGPNSVKRR
jgi:hypothetical protein